MTSFGSSPAANRRSTISGPTPDGSPIVTAIGALIATSLLRQQIHERVRSTEPTRLGDDRDLSAVEIDRAERGADSDAAEHAHGPIGEEGVGGVTTEQHDECGRMGGEVVVGA